MRRDARLSVTFTYEMTSNTSRSCVRTGTCRSLPCVPSSCFRGEWAALGVRAGDFLSQQQKELRRWSDKGMRQVGSLELGRRLANLSSGEQTTATPQCTLQAQ
mmetsp:Transcript_12349/g.23902  ORF Transcript_12349/g.23902 Transcript_12349/m.23902 type:complete len:103 (+) Transcript_12349:497-805(+)|eukprot:6189042-Pleurochrysis_carterae.AAC.3